MPINIEIKAMCSDPDTVRDKLMELGADYVGCDHQIDTYFSVPDGRLKLREGNIENNLIFYRRPDQSAARQSDFYLHAVEQSDSLKQLLEQAFEPLIVVDKKRHIFFLGNVKFHIDEVSSLGSFVEIEASNLNYESTVEELRKQCDHFVEQLCIHDSQMIASSYSDLMLAEESNV
ncbi:MAG: class IV adenylate cyclase [Planctomycetota bacterium]